MSVVMCNQGTGLMLEAILNKTAGQNVYLRLFKNNITPAATDVEGDYTEATFTGYSQKTLTGASWTVTAANPSTAGYAAQTFSSTANQTLQYIYGYYLVQVTSGKLLGAEKFSAPIPIQNNTDSIAFTPALTGDSAA